VLKIEPPGGDPGRGEAPLLEIGSGRLESAYFAWLNTNKQSIIADLTDPAEIARIAGLTAGADVLLDSRTPDEVQREPLAHSRLRAENPGLVITAISWFGESGPYRNFMASDMVCRALAGVVELVGPKDHPVAINDHQADNIAGLTAFIAAAAGIWSGVGRRFSLSIHEANISLSESHTAYGPLGPRGRLGINRFFNTYPFGVFKCKEGLLGVGANTPAQWHDFCVMLGLTALADNPKFRDQIARALNADEIEPHFEPLLLQRTAQEWFQEGLDRRLPFAVVPTMPELPQMEIFRTLKAFTKVQIGKSFFDAPDIPLVLPLTPTPSGTPKAPLAGEHDVAPRLAACGKAASSDNRLPLEGIRIVDFGMGWAGPLVTRLMADLGAEVVKIESCQHYDWWRGSDNRPEVYTERRYEKRPVFLVMNRNKLGITLELTSKTGVALVKRLVMRADAVVENYARDVLPKLGLDYDELRKVKEDLVMVSMPAFPAGSWEKGRAYGSTLEQAAGVPTIAGEADGPPMMSHYAYGDVIGALNATVALLIALMHRRATGKGQHIDISQVQCMLPLVAPWYIASAVTGQVPPRRGNRHPTFVPQNCFRCAGDDSWVLISITDDAMWKRLCSVIGRSDLREDSVLATAAGRREREAEIEAAVQAWTQLRMADEAMNMLQAAGVAAGVVRSPFDLGSDPHLVARGFWQAVDRPYVGVHDQPSVPFRENDTPYKVWHAAPTLGEFNKYVLGDLLGLSAAELEELEQQGVIGTEGVPPRPRGRKAGTAT
jgi:crotonobetainyl-CoA:carnitine CoA-transferase CaiB-like acyl-CoA transferase